MAFAEDFDVFFNPNDPGIKSATYTPKAYPPGDPKDQTIYGAFSKRQVIIDDVSNYEVIFETKESYFTNLQQDDYLTIDNVDYRIVNWEVDGFGLIELMLEKR